MNSGYKLTSLKIKKLQSLLPHIVYTHATSTQELCSYVAENIFFCCKPLYPLISPLIVNIFKGCIGVIIIGMIVFGISWLQDEGLNEIIHHYIKVICIILGVMYI